MRRQQRWSLVCVALLAFALGCDGCESGTRRPGRLDATMPSDADVDADADAEMEAGPPDAAPMDSAVDTALVGDADPLDPDAACASETVEAIVERLPVDIIWMVDNSTSMEPAIVEVQTGLNDFAALIAGRDLDYRVIMLSLRGMGESSSPSRFRVCIPPPLAGDAACADGPRFFQVDVDVRSTQPLEQFLGTLGQTIGYQSTDDRGSAPWRDLLRDEATKTIVVVTDDNARMVERDGSGGFVPGPGGGRSGGDPIATAEWFETFAGGNNPFNSTGLPEGILHARWAGIFDDYVFSGLYGWGSETDDSLRCEYPAGGFPPSSGPTYTALVERTGGVRAQLCEGPSAWGPFFDGVATAVERTSRIDCTIPIPPPPDGTFFQRDRINVLIGSSAGSDRLFKVPGEVDCDTRGGWYYDDEASPMNVVLCPASCEMVQPTVGETRTVDVQFGCFTLPI